jgi:hypothetical protein
LNINEATARVHGVGEHAAKLHALNPLGRGLRIGLDRQQRGVVALVARQLEQFLFISQLALDAVDVQHHSFQAAIFLAQLLAGRLGVVVKDTPGASVCARTGRAVGRRGR